MRRLLWIAIVLVFLVLVGFTFVRVTNTPAFVARSRLARIELGMSREQVLEVMAGLRSKRGGWFASLESWDVGGEYRVIVGYDRDVQMKAKVTCAWVDSPTEATGIDSMLDFFGYRKDLGELPSQTFQFGGGS